MYGANFSHSDLVLLHSTIQASKLESGLWLCHILQRINRYLVHHCRYVFKVVNSLVAGALSWRYSEYPEEYIYSFLTWQLIFEGMIRMCAVHSALTISCTGMGKRVVQAGSSERFISNKLVALQELFASSISIIMSGKYMPIHGEAVMPSKRSVRKVHYRRCRCVELWSL